MALESFNAYHSYLKSIELLNDAEVGRLFRACLEYSESGTAPELRGNERFVFSSIKAQIDRDKAAYYAKCETLRRNGEKAKGSKSRQKEAEATKSPQGQGQGEGQREGEGEGKGQGQHKGGAGGKKKTFTPPTLDEVTEYAASRNSPVDPVQFWEYFNSGNWVDAKGQPVKSWKQKFLTWESFKKQDRSDVKRGSAPVKGKKAEELDDFYRMANRWANE